MRWCDLLPGDVVVPPRDSTTASPWLVLGNSSKGLKYVMLSTAEVGEAYHDDERSPQFSPDVRVYRGAENVNK